LLITASSSIKKVLRRELHSGDFHYEILSVYAWRRSAVVHAKPRVRFVHHHITTTNFYSAGRIGEFAKSDMREDPEEDSENDAERELRGLHFQVTTQWSIFRTSTDDSQDAYMFAMFNKERRKAELSIRLMKDEKGKGDNPQDR